MTKKMLVVLLCLIIVLLTMNKGNTGIGEAEARLISKMLENDKVVQMFAMDDGGVET